MSFNRIALIVLLAAQPAFAQVVSYEGTDFPEQSGWNESSFCGPLRWLDNGWLHYELVVCPGTEPPIGQRQTFTQALSESSMGQNLFFEWVVQTDGDRSEIVGTAPIAFVLASSSTGVSYHFTVAKDQIRFIRGNFNPVFYVDLQSGVPHTHRLELSGSDSYSWYVDGLLLDSGMPDASISFSDAVIQWRTRSWQLPNDTQWNYIRYGTIPQPNSGDFDSNGLVDFQDLYFFVDGLLGPDYDAAGPGCKWADMNNDGVANGADIATFTAAML